LQTAFAKSVRSGRSSSRKALKFDWGARGRSSVAEKEKLALMTASAPVGLDRSLKQHLLNDEQ